MTPAEIVPDYLEYIRLQTEVYNPDKSDDAHHNNAIAASVSTALHHTAPLDGAQPRILDVASGPGVALSVFAGRGLGLLSGVEIHAGKCEKARRRIPSARIECRDMHDLSCFDDGSFDLIYCSHTLEHAYEPERLLAEFRRILAPTGRLFLALPYPDMDEVGYLPAHCARHVLGLNIPDNAATLISFISKFFKLDWRGASYVEGSEIWLVFSHA